MSIYVKYSRQKFAPVHAMKVYKGMEVNWPIYPQKETLVPIWQESGLAPELVWMFWEKRKISWSCSELNPNLFEIQSSV